MKKHWSVLPLSRRILCVVNVLLFLVFFIIYLFYCNRVVIRFGNDILEAEKGESAIYFSGEIEGAKANLTLFEEGALLYTLDGADYGPFTLVDDPTAVPPGNELVPASYYNGIEIRDKGNAVFRGGYCNYGTGILLADEGGTLYGGPSNPGEPDFQLIFHFLRNGRIASQANWIFFIIGTSFIALTLLTGFFKEPFFRAHMPLSKSEKELKEQEKPPLMRRILSWISWVALTLGAVFFLVSGLMVF